jgi:hypothetical protein
VGIPKRSCDAIAERLCLFFTVPIRSLTAGIKFHLAHAAFATRQTKRNYHAVADLQTFVVATDLDDLAHALVPKHIA